MRKAVVKHGIKDLLFLFDALPLDPKDPKHETNFKQKRAGRRAEGA